MDIQEDEYGRESNTSFNAINQDARRPRMGVRHHHGYPPYDVWNETIPYLPASIPHILAPPMPRCPRTIPSTRMTIPVTHHSTQHSHSSAMRTESDTLGCSDQEGSISYATRRHTPNPTSTACALPDPYRPLREFDMRGPHDRGRSYTRRQKLQRQQHTQDRQAVLLSCYASTLPPREQFPEPRGYLDEGSMYTTCDAPGDTKATSAFAATAITPPSALPPPEPPDPIEQAPCDSGCNLPITNPQTVGHFKLASLPWPRPRWIKFGNGKRECSTHYAEFGPIIGKVAILATAPDTLISVAVLCRKGLEVVFKIPGGPGIYLQGKLLYQGTLDPHNDMFYVNIKDLLSLSITFQNPERFTTADTATAASMQPPAAQQCYSTKKSQRRDTAITADKIRQVLWLHKRLGHPSRSRRNGKGNQPRDMDRSAIRYHSSRRQCNFRKDILHSLPAGKEQSAAMWRRLRDSS